MILAADWGKETSKRTVYAADQSSRVVRRITPNKAWTLTNLLDVASSMQASDSVIVALDAPLGVPQSFFDVAAATPSWRSPVNFPDLLMHACEIPLFFTGTRDASAWSIDCPFFSVPKGHGGLTSYIQAAAAHSVDLYRDIDRRTGAKSVFIKSGVPGSVGSAACALWQEIGPLLHTNRAFRLWPFEGELPFLRESAPIVLAEMYPRSAYATALLDASATLRPTLIVAKTKKEIRSAAIDRLRTAEWVCDQGVTIQNLFEAEANEDDFDALMTAAALLRCELEGIPLHPSNPSYQRAEGGILGTGSINLDLPARRFNIRFDADSVVKPTASALFQCPIPNCEKLYLKTRSGWDSHVGSQRNHPLWRPELESAHERKQQFMAEFPHFFR